MKECENIPNGLNAILYFLYYVYDVNDTETYQKLEAHIKNTYASEKIERFKQAVNWAIDTPEFIFEKQLPRLAKSHEEICVYFNHLKKILDKM